MTLTVTPDRPATYSKSANFIQVRITATNCTASPKAASSSLQMVEYNTENTWTPNTYYSFDAGSTQTSRKTNLTTPGATYSYTPANYKLASCTANYCSAKINSASGSAVSTSTYYASGTKIYWVADSNHSFGGSSAADTRSGTTTITAGGSPSMTPGYTKVTVNSTNCTANKSTGNLVGNGNDGVTQEYIIWTANNYYSFSEGTTRSSSSKSPVSAGTLTYGASAPYMYVDVTNGTGCTAVHNDGYWTSPMRFNANANYAFDENGTSTKDVTFTAGGTATASCTHLKCSYISSTNCTADKSVST